LNIGSFFPSRNGSFFPSLNGSFFLSLNGSFFPSFPGLMHLYSLPPSLSIFLTPCSPWFL
jgi:hypothetical protein